MELEALLKHFSPQGMQISNSNSNSNSVNNTGAQNNA